MRSRLAPWALRVVVVLAAALCAYLAGIATTVIWPTPVSTTFYRGSVTLQAWPSSTLSAPTVFGDIAVRFDSPVPAPGIVVETQVKADVTDLFSTSSLTPEDFRPSNADLRAAVTAALRGVALRFAVGVVGFLLVVLLIYALGRRRTPGLAQAMASAVAASLAILLPATAMWQTYRIDRVVGFEATSLLGTVRSNAGLLSNVQERSREASRYVTNVLALSQSLQETLVPPELNQTPAVRLLLVSDIHGANQYPIMANLVKDEKVDAIVDSGDLINFGSVQEAESAGFFTSIADLGVPYIFIRGNHDASSATDESLLKRLAQIPNVVLLEPSRKRYQEVSIGGITVGGFNDPRYYGDGDPHLEKLQKDRQQDFLTAYGDRALPDIVVSHEPAAVEGIKTPGLLINGHLHQPGLDGNRLTVGTFTGGGLFGRRIAETAEKGTEQATARYFFDIAVYGQQCSLINLTRYSFSSIVEGRPAYDGLNVINGRTIISTPPKDRTCAMTQGDQRTPITP